jgi:hypothetical protein
MLSFLPTKDAVYSRWKVLFVPVPSLDDFDDSMFLHPSKNGLNK